MGRKGAVLLLITVGGLLIGVVGDVVAGGVALSVDNVALAVVLSPILAAVGGRAVSIGNPEVFLVGGILYWPIWGALAWRWLRHDSSVWLALGILAWSAQGFFQLVHRLAMVMSA